MAGTDQPGQEVADAHLGRGQPVDDPGGVERRRLAREPQVGAERQAHAAAVGRSADRGDDRLGHRPHLRDEAGVVPHRPLRDPPDLQAVDVRDDPVVLQVEARAERPAGARQHHHPAVVVGSHLLERVVERDHEVDRHRVEPVGAVQRDDGDVVDRPVDEDELGCRAWPRMSSPVSGRTRPADGATALARRTPARPHGSTSSLVTAA